jgi:hypothetical protein
MEQTSPIGYHGMTNPAVPIDEGWIETSMAVAMAGAYGAGTANGCGGDRERVFELMDMLPAGEREQVARRAAEIARSIVATSRFEIAQIANEVVDAYYVEHGVPTEKVDLAKYPSDAAVADWEKDWRPPDSDDPDGAGDDEHRYVYGDTGETISTPVLVAAHHGGWDAYVQARAEETAHRAHVRAVAAEHGGDEPPPAAAPATPRFAHLRP